MHRNMHNLQESALHHSLQNSPYAFLSIKEAIVILKLISPSLSVKIPSNILAKYLYTGLDQKQIARSY